MNKIAQLNFSRIFIERPVATSLLTFGLTLSGAIAVFLLSVAPLPQVDFPTISVGASLPGADPETMAASVATPLERAFAGIAGVTEMTSDSNLGSTRISLQFDLDRDINSAALDVQGAINGARASLPSGMPNNPSVSKVNAADSPILIMAMTSDTLEKGKIYDLAATIIQQRLSQVDGVGQVSLGGSSSPAVRVDVDPNRLSQTGLSLENVRTAITNTNANRPKGALEEGDRYWQVNANDQARFAKDYLPVVVAYRNGTPVRVTDIAKVSDSVQDIRNAGSANGKQGIIIQVSRQPGANVIETADRVKALLPFLRASLPPSVSLDVMVDRTPPIRGSLREVERSLIISIALVIMVVFLFLRRLSATIIPAIVVPASLISSFSVMYLLGFSLNNFTLMAITIGTGFVVDDAIVVMENITRHIERGMSPMEAALKGSREIGFTVVSMSLSLVAVFIPVLLMGGIIGRLFHEFAITLSAAILISLVISLTTTPMMCARLVKREPKNLMPSSNRVIRTLTHWGQQFERGFKWSLKQYRLSLAWVLRHSPLVLIVLLATICLNVYLYVVIPKGFFPQQDNGRLFGRIQADQSTSFQAMQPKVKTYLDLIRADPAIDNIVQFGGGNNRNSAQLFMTLKPMNERKVSTEAVITRLRDQFNKLPGANIFVNSAQEFRLGGRQSDSSYQYTLRADSLDDLRLWEPRIRLSLTNLPQISDVNTNMRDKGMQTRLTYDRETASRLGINVRSIDTTLNNAFGQRQISTIYNPLNQYKVVLGLESQYLESPEMLRTLNITAPGGKQVPLAAISSYALANTALGVEHQGGELASTVNFNLVEGYSLSDATAAIDYTMAHIGVPSTVHGSFEGTARGYKAALDNQPLLILAAIVTIYLVLGMLYESYIHPITIISTLPSAGLGALLALLACKTEFSLIALIAVFLLIGLVKKNAIMMIDVALQLQRSMNIGAAEAIYRACLLRFRPIMMTTLAAMLGAIPLAVGTGDGLELRQPLGIAIVGGLAVSQVLTLYTTPVIYIYMDKLRTRWLNRKILRLRKIEINQTSLAGAIRE